MDQWLKTQEGASSKQIPVTEPKLEEKEINKYKSLHDLYQETIPNTCDLEGEEKINKETRELTMNQVDGKNDESSSKRKRGNEETRGDLSTDKKTQKFCQNMMQFGKKLLSDACREADKDNFIGDVLKRTPSIKGKEKLTQYTAQKVLLPPKAATSDQVQRYQVINRNDQLVPVIEIIDDGDEPYDRCLKHVTSKKIIPFENMIISEGDNQQSGNKLLLAKSIKHTNRRSSYQRSIRKQRADTTRALFDKFRVSKNVTNGIKGSSLEDPKGPNMENGPMGKTFLTASYKSDTSAVAAASPPMSCVSANSSESVIYKNKELHKQDRASNAFSSSSIFYAKSQAIASTGQSSTGTQSMPFWGIPMKNTKADKTGLTSNSHGADEMQLNVTAPSLNFPDEYMSSVSISKLRSSPKEMDLLTSISHGASGYHLTALTNTNGLDKMCINNVTSGLNSSDEFWRPVMISNRPSPPKEINFLNGIGNNTSGDHLTLRPPPVADETCLVSNAYGLNMKHANVTSDIHSTNGFMNSMMISMEPGSPKERDFLHIIGHGTSGHHLNVRPSHPAGSDKMLINVNSGLNSSDGVNNSMMISNQHAYPKERDFLNSIGNDESDQSWPLLPVAATHMNNDDGLLPVATQDSTISRGNSFAPYISQTTFQNNTSPTPLSFIDTLAAAHPVSYNAPSNHVQAIIISPTPLNVLSNSRVPFPSAQRRSSRRPSRNWDPYHVYLMLLGAVPWTNDL